MSSAGEMPAIIVISDDEEDEQSTFQCPKISSPIPPERFLGRIGNPESPGERRPKPNLKVGPPSHKKRRRSSESDVELVEVRDASKAKKTKREQRKAVSVPFCCVIYFVAAACTDWIFRHVLTLESSSL